MTDDPSDDRELAAGDFSSWLAEMQSAIRGERGSEVPCGSCNACCKASQFIHVGPEETDALSHIPAALLFRAPGLPRGHVLLGYDERGHCPMLVDDRCSIYEHRPRTCRTYDCRVFPAAGLAVEDEEKAGLARRTRRWRFGFPAAVDRVRHDAVRAAARFVQERTGVLPDGAEPRNTTQLAVLAIELHGAFVRRDAETGESSVTEPELEQVRAAFMDSPLGAAGGAPRGSRRRRVP